MKLVARLAGFAMCFAPALAHAFPLYALPRLLAHLPAPEIEAARINRSGPHLSGLDFVLSTFDRSVVGKFREAWHRVGNGALPTESVVLILRMRDGSFDTFMPSPTNEYKRFTFAWRPATIAIVHTHPNSSTATPEGGDLDLADKYKVPIFTLTSRGMFVYDPATRKTTRVLDGVEWGDDAAWQQLHARLAGRPAINGR